MGLRKIVLKKAPTGGADDAGRTVTDSIDEAWESAEQGSDAGQSLFASAGDDAAGVVGRVRSSFSGVIAALGGTSVVLGGFLVLWILYEARVI